MGIPIHSINQLVKIKGAGGDAIDYVGFIEAELSFPMGTHLFKTEALLLVLPTTEYQKRVPVTIGTSLTDMAVDSFGTLDGTKLTSLHGKLYGVLLNHAEKFRPSKYKSTQSKVPNP